MNTGKIRGELDPNIDHFSPFPINFRMPEDQDDNNSKINLNEGMTQSQFIKTCYGISSIYPFKGDFSFLNRDDKKKVYNPDLTDPYVFNGWSSIDDTWRRGIKRIQKMVELGKGLGLKIKIDPDRHINILDQTSVINTINQNTNNLEDARRLYDDISFLLGNQDIALKMSLVRHVGKGWWVDNHHARTFPLQSNHIRALKVIIKAFSFIKNSKLYHRNLDELYHSNGDPLESHVGYHIYNSNFQNNVPLGKLSILEIYKNTLSGSPDFNTFKERVIKACPNNEFKQFPFATAPARRQQAGYAWNKVWTQTNSGMLYMGDFRKCNKVRKVWMESWLYNLSLTPTYMMWKAIRMCIPGCYHDGQARQLYLSDRRQRKPFSVESDYSNYDRNMSLSHRIHLVQSISSLFSNGKKLESFALSTMLDRWVLWPDQMPGVRGNGVAFKTNLGLTSGLKFTSEMGTLFNLWITCDALLRMKYFNEDSLYEYLISSAKAGSHISGKPIFFALQSDDAEFAPDKLTDVLSFSNIFSKVSQEYGVTAKVEYADRFLMRRTMYGRDLPVMERISQNTISNESPYTDPIIFIVGLIARLDGCQGFKLVDPFGTGSRQQLTKLQLEYTLSVLNDLKVNVSEARVPIKAAVEVIQLHVDITKSLIEGKNNDAVRSFNVLQSLAVKYSRILASRDDVALSDDESYSMNIKSQAYSMSDVMMQNFLVHSDPTFKRVLTRTSDKEHGMFMDAISKLSLDIMSYIK